MKITIVLPISRTIFLKPVFDCLWNLSRPDNTELIILLDGNDELERAVRYRLQQLGVYQGSAISSEKYSFTEIIKVLVLEYEMCKVWRETRPTETELVQKLSCRVYEKLANKPPPYRYSKEKGYLSELIKVLLEKGYLEKTTLRSLSESELTNASPRLHQAKKSDMALSRMSSEPTQSGRKSQVESPVYTTRIIKFGDTPAESIDERRYRISAIHNRLRYEISDDTDYVFSIEDDTTYPADTLRRLINTIRTNKSTAFVQGVQMGRRKTPYIGGWLVDDVYKPSTIQSVMPQDEIQRVEAGGLYCALIDAELYKMHFFEPFDKVGINGLSCDLNFGLYLSQQGYKCLMDWGIKCDHISDRGSVNLGNTEPCKVLFERRNTKWTSRVSV